MIFYKLFVCLFGISVYLSVNTVARNVIIGGHKAEKYQFHYQVSVQIEDYGHICGGGIIDEQHILTAAHCIIDDFGQFDEDQFFVLFGANNLINPDNSAFHVNVVKMYVPKEFVPPAAKTAGDIAVLKLKERLDFNQHRHLMRLKLPKNRNKSYVHEKAMISGFGWNFINVRGKEESGNNTDGYLRYATTHVISNNQCLKEYRVEWLVISEKKLCAKVEQFDNVIRGVCDNDSGSPLVHDGHTVIGVLCLSPPGCSEKESAGIYTRVSHYLDFIEHATHDKPHDDIREHVVYSSP